VTPGRPLRVLGVADSDSYIKWAAALLDRMPAEWTRDLVVLATPAQPTERQLEAVLAGTDRRAPRLEIDELEHRIRSERPDVVVLALRGPVVRFLARAVDRVTRDERRPVIVTGMPGISIPATYLALYYRAQTDLLLLHSAQEIRAFQQLAADNGLDQRFALANLAFLPAPRSAARGDDVVFAAQAKVPAELEDRVLLLERLADVARRRPDRRVVLKLRGLAGEPQTHAERYPFDTLLAGLADAPPNLVVSTAPMSDALARASVLATVSSTAAIEAIAMRVPVVLLDDFGVCDALINSVFVGSGLFAPSSSLVGNAFPQPDARWVAENYLHDTADADWVDAIQELAERHAGARVPLRRQIRGTFGGGLRRVWDRKLALGRHDRTLEGYAAAAVVIPARGAVRRVRRLRARLGTRA
jgi:hypothetical protein